MAKGKILKREEAHERQLVYDGLTTQQKLDRLPVGGKSLKEIHKLTYKSKSTPSKGQQYKTDKLSRKERWANKQKIS
jgi:hypothetical protein